MQTAKRMRFHMEVIWRCLFWYFRYSISLRHVAEMMLDRGIKVSHVSIYNWILKFTPQFEKKFRKYKLPVNTSWRLDETYIKIKGKWKYLYRAVDKHAQTIDFLLTAKRDKKAAKRFLKRAVRGNGIPEKINIDKSGSNTAGINSYNQDNHTNIEIRQNKYLNNLIEQDHRSVKRHTKQILGFKTFNSAKIILTGIEIMSMIFKNQSGYLPLFNQKPTEAYWALVQA